jgi:hypothetical protein
MKIIHPLMADSFPSVRVEQVEDDVLSETFSLTVDGDQIATLTALDPDDQVELEPDTHTNTRISGEGCWRLDIVDPIGHPVSTQILFLPDQLRPDGMLTGELAAWATLASIWSCRLGPGPGCG